MKPEKQQNGGRTPDLDADQALSQVLRRSWITGAQHKPQHRHCSTAQA